MLSRHICVTLIERAEKTFGGLLERKAEMDGKRNVLQALRRYQLIFNLPASIHYHIQNQQHDKLVRVCKLTNQI